MDTVTETPTCSIIELPQEARARAAERAVEINPANAPSAQAADMAAPGVPVPESQSLAVLTDSYWGSGGVHLTVGFMENADRALRKRILFHMNAWSQWANVSFVESASHPQVRITLSGGGFQSALGRHILGVRPDKPTMHLGGLIRFSDEASFVRHVRHETGHTLGFPHEHLREEIVKRIDRDRAIAYFMKNNPGWDPQKVIKNVLTPMPNSIFTATAKPDPDSVMCYELPASIMKDGVAVRGGPDISAMDARFAAQQYPK